MLDFLLAAGHHLAVFALAILLGSQMVLMRPGIGASQVQRLGRIDIAYGAVAGLVVVAGVLRVIFGAAGADTYLENEVFWVKMTLFALIGLISVAPTVSLRRWQRRLADDPAFRPAEAEVRRLRMMIHIEAGLFLLIPVAAAALARGFGS